MKYNSEHYLISQMYQTQETKDVQTDRKIKEFIERFKLAFGDFYIKPGTFKTLKEKEDTYSNSDTKISFEVSCEKGNLKQATLIIDKFFFGDDKVLGNFIDDTTKIYLKENFREDNVTFVNQSEENGGIYCCSVIRDQFKGIYDLDISYYDLDTLNCLIKNYNLSIDEIVKLTKKSIGELGMEPDKENTKPLSEIKGYYRDGSDTELDLNKQIDAEYFFYHIADFKFLKEFVNQQTRSKK